MTGKKRASVQKCSWSAEEDRILLELVSMHGPKRWSLIAHSLEGRTGKQCRERWHNHLNPAVRKDAWTPQEDAVIAELVQRIGTKWATIAKHLDGRTDNSIKNRYYSSLKKHHDGCKPPRAHKKQAASAVAAHADDDEDDDDDDDDDGCDDDCEGEDEEDEGCEEDEEQQQQRESPIAPTSLIPPAVVAEALAATPHHKTKPKTSGDRKRRHSWVSAPDSPPAKRERRTSCVSVSSVAESLPGDDSEALHLLRHQGVVSSPTRKPQRRGSLDKAAVAAAASGVVVGLHTPAGGLQPQGGLGVEGGYTLHVRVVPSSPRPTPQSQSPHDDVHNNNHSHHSHRAHGPHLVAQHNLLWAHLHQHHLLQHQQQQQQHQQEHHQHQHHHQSHRPQEHYSFVADLDEFPSVPLPPLSLELQYNSMLEV